MANGQQETKRTERIKALARGYYGQHLIAWLEEIKLTYSDVRNAKKLGMTLETACAVAGILEDELINPLKQWQGTRDSKPQPSGEEME
ncbi:MAG: hypothetical protein M1383_06155 [Patescibacteria group bacterium]|nr:hypothetical protein [Patescibacteria group bacterium]